MGCLICERIEMIKKGTNPYFVAELETGYVVIGDHQHFRGYTLFLCKEHVTELHYLQKEFKIQHLKEMSLVAEAVFHVFKPEKLNYEALGNGDSHLHWHLFPRVTGDTPIKGPVWLLPPEEMFDAANRPSEQELDRMKRELRDEIDRLVQDNNERELHD